MDEKDPVPPVKEEPDVEEPKMEELSSLVRELVRELVKESVTHGSLAIGSRYPANQFQHVLPLPFAPGLFQLHPFQLPGEV